MTWQRVILVALAAAFLLTAAWLLRFDMQAIRPGGEGKPVAYVLDRWTGTTYFLHPDGHRELRPDGSHEQRRTQGNWVDLDAEDQKERPSALGGSIRHVAFLFALAFTLSLVIDIAAAFALAKYIKKLWVQIPLAIAVGLGSPIVSNFLLHLAMPNEVTAGEAAVRMIGGLIWHPLIALVALYFFRRQITKHRLTAQ
jgi:hypothetical protein